MAASLPKALQHDGDVSADGETLVFNPFNPANTEIRLDEVQSILKTYGVPHATFNVELFKRAFVHRSYTKRPDIENARANIRIEPRPPGCMALKTKSNERLEFLGDGVLELITKYYLYRRFPKADEGFMTEKKIALVRNEHIGRLALEMGLHKWLLLSKHAEEKRTRTNLKKLGCLFEAFLGALFLDFNKISVKDEEKWFTNVFVTGPGFQMAQTFVESIFEQHVDWTHLIETDDNYKNILQVRIQREFKLTPDYLEHGHDPESGFSMGVYVCLGQPIHAVRAAQATPFNEFGTFDAIRAAAESRPVLVRLGQATHKIKKKAEQLACQRALAQIGAAPSPHSS